MLQNVFSGLNNLQLNKINQIIDFTFLLMYFLTIIELTCCIIVCNAPSTTPSLSPICGTIQDV